MAKEWNRSSSSSVGVVAAGGAGGGDSGVEFINPTPLASRCAKPCGSSIEALQSPWIQRLIPGVLGDLGLPCLGPQDGSDCQFRGETQRHPQGESQAQAQGQPQDEGLGKAGQGQDKMPSRDGVQEEVTPLLLEGTKEQEEEGQGQRSHCSDRREEEVIVEETGKEPRICRSCTVQLQGGQDVEDGRDGAGACEKGADETGSLTQHHVEREMRWNRGTHAMHISSQVDGHAGVAGKSSQSFSRVTARQWCLKPPVSSLNPTQLLGCNFAGPPDGSGTLGIQLSPSHAPPDLPVSGPSEDISNSALGLRDSALDCSQSAGFHHPAVSSPIIPYQEQQGREQSHAGISRPVLLEGIHPQCGQALRGSFGVSSGVGTSRMSPAVGLTQLIQFQKNKQEAGFRVGTRYDCQKTVGSATKVTEYIIKEKDASLLRPSSLPPLSLFKPFKHVTEQHQQQGHQGKEKVDERVSLLTPLFHPLSYLGIDNVARDGIAACLTEKLDKHAPVLTPLYEPFKQVSSYSHDSRVDKRMLADKSLILTPIFTPFKSPKDCIQLSNVPSQCSSKTASLPPDLVAPLELDTYDSVDGREGRSGQNSDTDSKRNRDSSVYALQLSNNSSPIIAPADPQIQLLHGHGDIGVKSYKHSPLPNSLYGTAPKNLFDRSQAVKDLSTTPLLELEKGSSTQGTATNVKGPIGQPHIHLNNQLDRPVRDPRGFYFPLSEGSCGSNPLVAAGDSIAGQYAPLFQPASSSGHTVANKQFCPVTKQLVHWGGSRVSVGPSGEADLHRQQLGRRMGTMEFVRGERETGIAKRKGQSDGRMGENLQQPGDGHDGALLKKRTQVSPRAFEDPSSAPNQEGAIAGNPPMGEEGHIEEKLQPPAQPQRWLQRWMPLSKHGSGSVNPDPSLPEASRLHADGKSEHDLELQGSHSTMANRSVFMGQGNPNVEGSLGLNPKMSSVFGPGIPSVAALALVGAATRTAIP